MSVETDTLAQAALRFSEAIQSERATTLEALERERKATVQIIEALRKENSRRARVSTGRFMIGFLIGAALGAIAVSLLSPKSGAESRLGLTANLGTARSSLTERVRAAISAGQRAASTREQELWTEYRQRLASGEKPRDEPFRY
jgi:gas vesicle protein